MGIRTFCDVCGDEKPHAVMTALRFKTQAGATIRHDFGILAPINPNELPRQEIVCWPCVKKAINDATTFVSR